VFADEIEPACDRALAPLEAREPSPSSLEEALAAYALVVQRSMGELAPSLRRARRTLEQLLRSNIDDPTAWGALLAGAGGRTLARDQALWELGRAPPSERPSLLAGYLARFGAYAPVWDVAAPPDDEAPDRVLAAAELIARGPSPASRHEQAAREARAAERAAIHRVRNQESHGTAAAQGFQAILEAARRALAIGEDDDALFFRAQRVVRRPLRALGEALAAASVLDGPDAVFDLPIDEARRLARDPARLARTLDPSLARRGRAAREAAQRLAPPVAIRGGAPTWRGGAGALVGAGTAGRARGRAFVLDDPARAPATLPPETVLVARAILPSLTYLIPAAAALVTDHGGALSHGATLAREYGVPAVLGTGSATRVLRDGDALLVDADGGRVLRLGKP